MGNWTGSPLNSGITLLKSAIENAAIGMVFIEISTTIWLDGGRSSKRLKISESSDSESVVLKTSCLWWMLESDLTLVKGIEGPGPRFDTVTLWSRGVSGFGGSIVLFKKLF